MSTPKPTLTDQERILGQIRRGEVRVGPAAAREIARQHEAAYGAAFHQDRDTAWADAVNTVLPSHCPCTGDESGYRQHQHAGTTACRAAKDSHSAYQRNYRQKQRDLRGNGR